MPPARFPPPVIVGRRRINLHPRKWRAVGIDESKCQNSLGAATPKAPTTWLGGLARVEWVIKQMAGAFASYAGSDESLFSRLKTANGESRVEEWSSKALMDGSVTMLLAEDERKGGNISGKELLRALWGMYFCSCCCG